jgi:predicted dehydrogenase
MRKLRLAVVGVGHLGKEHARILAGMNDVDLVAVVDKNPTQARLIAEKCGTKSCTSARELVGLIDAACIVVPTAQHLAVARELIRGGIALLVEKPLAPNLAEAEELVDLASKYGVLLQVGHIERFNPAFLELEQRPLRPQLIEAERQGLFSGRALDVGVVLDLMIHDIELALCLARSRVREVEAVGVSLFGGHEDVADARLRFENGVMAHLRASRVSSRSSRKLWCLGAEGFAEIDFAERRLNLTQPSHRLRSEGIEFDRLTPRQIGEVRERLFVDYLESLEITRKEGDQLTLELRHFLNCIRQDRQPKVSGREGLQAVAVATQIIEAMNRREWAYGHSAKGPKELLPLTRGQLFEPGRDAARVA